MGAGPAERLRRAGRRDRARQPLRQPDHRRPRRGPPAAGALAPARAASRRTCMPPPGEGESTHRPVLGRPDDGLRVRRAARRDRALPRRPAPHGRRRRPRPDPAGAMRQGTFDDNRQARGPGRRARTGAYGFSCEPPSGDIGLRRKVDRFPFVPDDAERLALDCYEAYNIQVSGLEQRLRAIGQPKVVIGVSGGLDSTHALIVAAKAMDRLGRPRSDILAFTHAGVRDRRLHQGQRHPARQGARGDLRGARHPARREADARPTSGHPFARRRGGVRRHLRERPGRPAHRLPVPARQPPRRHRARHRRPLRAGAGLVHLRRRRPDVALHRELRRAEDPDPAPDPLGGLHASSSTARSTRCSPRSSSRRSPPS